MIYGLGAGILWALQTLILSYVFSENIFIKTAQAIFLAPFICSFYNDTISGAWLFYFRKLRKKDKGVSLIQTLNKNHGKLFLLSGIIGGPLGMSAYVLSIQYVGASYTAVISALFPAIGSILAYFFLKEKLSKKQLLGIILCAVGSISMISMPENHVKNLSLFFFAFTCAFCWGLEAVISSYAMKKGKVSSETALQIRQGMSTICYVILFLPLLQAWGFTIRVLMQKSILLLMLTAFLEAGSYLLYYKAISRIGAVRATSLNITYIIWILFFGVIFLHQIPSANQIINIGFLLIGIYFVAKVKTENN